MPVRSICGIAFSLFALFALPYTATAQGVIIPIICDVRPCPRPIPRPVPLPNTLPVKSIQLDTKINGQVATTHVVQVFGNDTPYTLEGTYFFPIPETASIVEFTIWEGGKKLVGEAQKNRRVVYTMKSFGGNAIPACSNMPERTFSRRRSFQFSPIRTKNLN